MSHEPLSWAKVQARYAAYCLAHGAITPQEMLERDAVAYPGGKMAGYMVWCSQRCAEWRRDRKRQPNSHLNASDHDDFTDWLLTDAMRIVRVHREFAFVADATEVSSKPAIVRNCPSGGDDRVLAVLGRVYQPDALYDLCALANLALQGMPLPSRISATGGS